MPCPEGKRQGRPQTPETHSEEARSKMSAAARRRIAESYEQTRAAAIATLIAAMGRYAR